jgi:hypothetical protein
MNHSIQDNGSSSTEELDLSELTTEETMPSLTDKDTVSRSMSTLLLDHGLESHTKSFLTSQVLEEILEIHQENALMSTETKIETTIMLSSGSATMEPIKDGPSIEEEFTSQDIH